MLTWLDAEYPARLRELRDAPPVLYLRGVVASGPAVAVVGTRRPSAYGRDVTRSLGEVLGSAGVVVISGLARGIDAAAHAGALRPGGSTVGVLGCGVDIVYPPEHRTLMEAMLVRGGAATFQGRPVYAVPGSVFAPGSRGPHRLLASGAAVLSDPGALLEGLGVRWPAPAGGRHAPRLGEDEARVLDMLGEAPVHIDGLIERSGLGAGRVAGALATLEVRGLVRQSPGNRFARRSGFAGPGAQDQVGGDTWPNHSSL